MLTYTYQAKDVQGEMLVGQIQGHSRQQVAKTLKQKGLYLIEVEAQSKLAAILSSGGGLGARVSVKDKAIFTHQLATLLKAGLKITDALGTLSKQTKNKNLQAIVCQIREDIESSSSLSQSMAKHPRVFSSVYTAVVEAAEQSGALAQTLAVLSVQLKSQASVNARIKSALIYPIFLLAVSALVVGVLMTFVIPKFIELFINANQALPLPTRILVYVTNFFKDSWWIVIMAATGLTGTFLSSMRSTKFKASFDSFLLGTPIVGELIQKLQLSRFARTLGSLLNGGVRILEAVVTTKGTTSNIAFAKEIAEIEQLLFKGSTLAQAMSKQRHFSEIAINMVAVGEETGALPEMLLELADMYDQECESAIGSITTLLGPLMILVLGFVIGFVVLAILMPIFETSTMVG